MTFEEIYQDLEGRLSKKRFRHVCGVVKAAEALAKRYGANVEQARLAALLHDCAKEEPLDTMQAIVKVEGLQLDSVMLNSGALLHSEAGAVLAKTRYGIEDAAICEAVRLHTVGKPHMTTLDKIVFLADYIEENRDFPGVDLIRAKAKEDLNEGVLAGYDTTLAHLLETRLSIYEPTVVSRNALLEEMKNINR